jgi:hypothetical protein
VVTSFEAPVFDDKGNQIRTETVFMQDQCDTDEVHERKYSDEESVVEIPHSQSKSHKGPMIFKLEKGLDHSDNEGNGQSDFGSDDGSQNGSGDDYDDNQSDNEGDGDDVDSQNGEGSQSQNDDDNGSDFEEEEEEDSPPPKPKPKRPKKPKKGRKNKDKKRPKKTKHRKHKKHHKKRKYSSSEDDSSSSSSTSSSEDSPSPPPKKKKKTEDGSSNVMQMMSSMMQSFQAAQAQQTSLLAQRLKLLEQSAGPSQEAVPPEESRQPPIQGGSSDLVQSQSQSEPVVPGVGTVPSTQEESDLDDDANCKTRAESHAQRRGVIKSVLKGIPHFSFEVSNAQRISASQQCMMGYQAPTPDAISLPIQQAISDQVKQSALNMAHTKKIGKKPKQEAIFRRLYKIPEDQAEYWDHPTPPAQELLNATNPNKIWMDKKLGQKVLKSNLAKQSAREQHLIESIKRSQVGFKMGNCLLLSLVAGIHVLGQVQSKVEVFATQEATAPEKRDLDTFGMAELAKQIKEDLGDLQTCLTEAQVNSADMVKCHSLNFVKDTQERRDLWVDQSDLATDQKDTLKQLVIPTPPLALTDDYPMWDFIGPVGRKKIVDWQASDLQRSQIIRARHTPSYQQHPSGKKSNQPKRQNTNQSSKPKPPQNQPKKDSFQSKPQGNRQQSQPFRGGRGGGRFRKNKQ